MDQDALTECNDEVAQSGMGGGTGCHLICDNCQLEVIERRLSWLEAYHPRLSRCGQEDIIFSLFKKKPEGEPKKVDPAIFPRLRNKGYFDRLKAAGVPSEQMPLSEPLIGDIMLLYGIDKGDTFSLIAPPHPADHGWTLEALKKLAMANCAAALEGMAVHAHGAVHRLTAPNSVAGCSILFPNIWEMLEANIGGRVIVAIASQDAVYYVRDEPGAVSVLKQTLVQEGHDSADSILSAFLYQLDGNEWWQVVHVA